MKKMIPALLLVFVAGCNTAMTGKQLERVAKDWCLTIRASQVIPVYPLTEDLQPGDVFLVQAPLGDQVAMYKSKGFLPLENLVVRLKPDTYESFYSNRYGIDNGNFPPKCWQFPYGSITSADFTIAPLSAFPTYTFSVSHKEGLNVALPVQGIPVGLNMMGAGKAHGSIAITDSYTYGIDMQRMWELVNDWSEEKPNKEFLKQFEPAKSEEARDYHYLRVVNRVYLTGKVNISIFNDEDYAGEGSGGVPKPVNLLGFANYSSGAKAMERINTLISSLQGQEGEGTTGGMAAGGTLRVAMASSRSVSLVEKFNRPLVIGYIAFDLPILQGGKLGPPVSTEAQLMGRKSLPGRPAAFGTYKKDSNSVRINGWLKDTKNYDVLAEWLERTGHTRKDIPAIIYGEEFANLRQLIVEQFRLN